MNSAQETTVQIPWSEQREDQVKASLNEWAASLPSECPYHGEQTSKQTRWEWKHGAPAGYCAALLRCWLNPCPACKLAASGVPKMFLHCNFDNFVSDTAELRANLTKVREFAANPVGFLFLLGRCGTGKTHLAAATLREFGGGLYYRHLTMIEELRDSYRQGRRFNMRGDPIPSIADACRSTSLLVLDELGVAPGGNDADTLIYNILDHRVSEHSPAVIISNHTAGDMEAVFGDRLADRFRQASFAVLNFTGPSHRKNGNAEYLAQARARSCRDASRCIDTVPRIRIL